MGGSADGRLAIAKALGLVALFLSAHPPNRLSAQSDPIRVTISVDRTTAAPGDSLRATLVVTNTDSTQRMIRWLSGHLYDFHVLGPRGRELWTWSTGYGFDQAIHPRMLEPGQQLVFSEKVPMPRTPGTYRVSGVLTTQPVRTASVVVTVR
jgi:hypothetical protein